MKFLALAAAASALRLSACDCNKSQANSGCDATAYAAACPALNAASVATCCEGGVATGAKKSGAACASFTGCA